MNEDLFDQDRRRLLKASLLGSALALVPRFGLAASARSDTRLLVVLLRGGMDGLHAVQPHGDRAYAGLRGRLLDASRGAEPRRLDATFSLHPAFAFAHQLYGEGRLLPIVAVAPPYRQRSHFEAQDCLENGTTAPGARTGWLNRCVSAMAGDEALALAAMMPLILRGPGNARSWSPPLRDEVNPILMQRLQVLYAQDEELAPMFAQLGDGTMAVADSAGTRARSGRLVANMQAAARFMSEANGPRIGFVEDTGWDTHGNQAGILGTKFKELDSALQAFHAQAQSIWGNTVVAVVTEFGRTAALNGTGGTDHGTGGMALLAGGAVQGGRVTGDWPGLAPLQLNDGRDLRTTTDMRALFKGVLQDHLHLGLPQLTDIFPDSAAIKPMEGLIHARR